jgi:hypothetical protein
MFGLKCHPAFGTTSRAALVYLGMHPAHVPLPFIRARLLSLLAKILVGIGLESVKTTGAAEVVGLTPIGVGACR